MKKDDLIDGLGKISDDLINEADKERNKRKSKRTWLVLVPSLALALVLVFQFVLPLITNSRYDKFAVAQADYPALAEYPGEDGSDRKYNKWYDDFKEKAEATKGVDYTSYQALFAKLNKEILTDEKSKNVAYSPLNIYMATSMLAEVTGGISRDQVLELLEIRDLDYLRKNSKKIFLDNYNDDGRYSQLLANSIWIKEDDDRYKEDTLENLTLNYYSSLYRGDTMSPAYSRALQDWINSKTGNLLENSVKNIQFDPDTVMALVSTIYFKDSWAGKFYKENNVIEDFNTLNGPVHTEYMRSTRRSQVYGGDNFLASSIHYKNSGSMVFVKPDEGSSIKEVLNSPEFHDLIFEPDIIDNQKELDVNFKIPKFDVTTDLDMKETMVNLGLTSVFEEDVADFSNLIVSEYPVYVTDFLHSSKITIDEEGTEAAAYTVVMTKEATSAPLEDLEEIDFFLDRPFIFVIKGESGQPSFIGVINNPNQ